MDKCTSFRSRAAYGKRIEYFLIGKMLKEGLDVYTPMVDDDAIDAVVKRPNGQYVEIQIKARASDVNFGDAALFAAITHRDRPNYWFVFYSERLNCMWIMSSSEFIKEAVQNRSGVNKGKYSIWFNGRRKGQEYAYEKFDKYRCEDFSRVRNEDPNTAK